MIDHRPLNADAPVNCRCTIAPILAPVTGIEPLPKLTFTPSRLYAEPIIVDDYDDVAAPFVADLVREVEARLMAEDARMRRLLPPAPKGHEWRAEIAHEVEHLADFTMHDVIRLRYRLVADGVGNV